MKLLRKAFSTSGNRGFGLVEMMVSITSGMVVSGAAISFLVASMNSNTNYVRTARFTQDLRNNMGYVTSELRRAGYDESAMRYIALSASSNVISPFAPMKIVRGNSDDSCVIYAYDSKAVKTSTGTGPGYLDVASGEIHGLRRASRTVNGQSIGIIEVAQSSAAATTLDCDGAGPDYTTYPAACNAASGWCALSDPQQLDITSFRIVDNSIWNPPTAASFGSKVRDLGVTMQGVLIGKNEYSRSLQTNVRVRAECMRPIAAVDPPDTTGMLCDTAPGS
jgi:Tfp pilus assembly protein PilW